jgi:hypothetical protein
VRGTSAGEGGCYGLCRTGCCAAGTSHSLCSRDVALAPRRSGHGDCDLPMMHLSRPVIRRRRRRRGAGRGGGVA